MGAAAAAFAMVPLGIPLQLILKQTPEVDHVV
jgi:hypothetical protein